ncbi:signal peptidase II [Catenulispora pinisilvae]|uniref:signal peptidase II n=1 Tax=Catenulispora pinisilvae TaxID=2705253 RepID=UPI001890D797|nr:signal peptidase II [Catenulispora pinisilvae]
MTAAPEAGVARSRIAWSVGIATTVVLLDLVSKTIVASSLVEGGQSTRILGGLVYFSLLRNPGAAFGTAGGMTVVFTAISAGAVVAFVRLASRIRSLPWAVALGLLMGGALGNLIDRLFRAPGFPRGHVVDFISVFGPNGRYFPIFNLADSALTTGAVMLVVVTMFGVRLDNVKENLDGEPIR